MFSQFIRQATLVEGVLIPVDFSLTEGGGSNRRQKFQLSFDMTAELAMINIQVDENIKVWHSRYFMDQKRFSLFKSGFFIPLEILELFLQAR